MAKNDRAFIERMESKSAHVQPRENKFFLRLFQFAIILTLLATLYGVFLVVVWAGNMIELNSLCGLAFAILLGVVLAGAMWGRR